MTEPEVELIIIGDGPLRPKLETLASRCLNHYSFLGLQSQDVVKLWMNRSKVFCVPSLETDAGDAEGFGIVFAEAQAMGLPVVSSMSGGIPEAVAHKETGFLVPERDWEAIAEYILQLVQNSSLWTQFSLQGRARIQSNFDLHKQIQLLENIYQDVSQLRQYSPS